MPQSGGGAGWDSNRGSLHGGGCGIVTVDWRPFAAATAVEIQWKISRLKKKFEKCLVKKINKLKNEFAHSHKWCHTVPSKKFVFTSSAQ